VRHATSLTWRSSVGFSPTKNLCATPVLTSTRSALPIGALACGGVWDPVEGLICMRTPTGPDYVCTLAYNSHQESSKGDGVLVQVQIQVLVIMIVGMSVLRCPGAQVPRNPGAQVGTGKGTGTGTEQVQNRYRTGTEQVQNRYRTGTGTGTGTGTVCLLVYEIVGIPACQKVQYVCWYMRLLAFQHVRMLACQLFRMAVYIINKSDPKKILLHPCPQVPRCP